ncbi:MAG: hypothetical protein ACOYK9_00715 [Chlamydiia bacterium]
MTSPQATFATGSAASNRWVQGLQEILSDTGLLKITAVQSVSLISGAVLGLKVLRNRPMIFAVPALAVIASLSAVGFQYPSFIVNGIENLLKGAK